MRGEISEPLLLGRPAAWLADWLAVRRNYLVVSYGAVGGGLRGAPMHLAY